MSCSLLLEFETIQRELRLFGHDFEGRRDGPCSLYRAIDPALKDSIRYSWCDDELLVAGESTASAVSGPV